MKETEKYGEKGWLRCKINGLGIIEKWNEGKEKCKKFRKGKENLMSGRKVIREERER